MHIFDINRTQNIRRYEYTKDNKLECVYSGNTLLVAYSYDGDGTITSSLDRDLDLNQNLNINDHSYINRLTNNQRRLINKINPSDTILYEMTEYVLERNQEYSQVLMERDGAGNLSTLYTYGNQRINSESYNNLTGLYTYDGRGSVSAVLGTWGDFRATYWYDGLGNVKSQIHGFGAFGSGKKYYGYNAEQYNPVTGNQNLRARQVNIRRQRFLSEDTYIGNNTDILSLNRYIYASDNPLINVDPDGLWSVSAQGGIGTNIFVGPEIIAGRIWGYNSHEGEIDNLINTGSLVFSTSPGGGLTGSIAFDFTDNKVNEFKTTSFGISFGTPFKFLSINFEINFDSEKIGLPTGFSIGGSLGASWNPLPIAFYEKQSWSHTIISNNLNVEGTDPTINNKLMADYNNLNYLYSCSKN